MENKIKSRLISTSGYLESNVGGLRCEGYFKYSFPDKPLLTVITVVYNGERHLEQTIQSVINQSYKNIEYIVIDGQSTDKTLQIIFKYEESIDYWLSEPDNGISDAMNKGVNLSTGDYIIFINSDDYFESRDSLELSTQGIIGSDLILCDILYGSDLKKLLPRNFGFWLNFKLGFSHQSVLCSRRVFDCIGGFDTNLKIAMDYDFFLRAYRHGFKSNKANSLLSVMRDTGVSSKKDCPSLVKRLIEEKKIHEKNCNSKLLKRLYKVYWIFYMPYKKLISLIYYGFD
jgi:glycosyltransferase involved in cell wall biosynthesis